MYIGQEVINIDNTIDRGDIIHIITGLRVSRFEYCYIDYEELGYYAERFVSVIFKESSFSEI